MPARATRPLRLSPRAVRDIAAIEAYYAQFGLATADRVIAAIHGAAQRIQR
ncbi:MAG: type II toxin-antitoxin system RelE/ParE family toxin, partial [Burkholderiales bacterium]